MDSEELQQQIKALIPFDSTLRDERSEKQRLVELELTEKGPQLEFDVFMHHLAEFHGKSRCFIRGINWSNMMNSHINMALEELEHYATALVETFQHDKNQLKLKYICRIIAKCYCDSALYSEALRYYAKLMSLDDVKPLNENELEAIRDKIAYTRCLVETGSDEYSAERKLDIRKTFNDLRSDLELTNTRDIANLVIDSAYCVLHGMLQNFVGWEEKDDEYFVATNTYIMNLKNELSMPGEEFLANHLLEGYRLFLKKDHRECIHYLIINVFKEKNNLANSALKKHSSIQSFCGITALLMKAYMNYYPTPDVFGKSCDNLSMLMAFVKKQRLTVHDRLTAEVNNSILDVAKRVRTSAQYFKLSSYIRLSPHITCFQTIKFLHAFGQIGLTTIGPNLSSHQCFKEAATMFECVARGKEKSLHCLYLIKYLFTTYKLEVTLTDKIQDLVNQIIEIASHATKCELYVALAKSFLASVNSKADTGVRTDDDKALLTALSDVHESLRLFNKLEDNIISLEEEKNDQPTDNSSSTPRQEALRFAKFQQAINYHITVSRVFRKRGDIKSAIQSLTRLEVLNRILGNKDQSYQDTIAMGEELMQLTQLSFT